MDRNPANSRNVPKCFPPSREKTTPIQMRNSSDFAPKIDLTPEKCDGGRRKKVTQNGHLRNPLGRGRCTRHFWSQGQVAWRAWGTLLHCDSPCDPFFRDTLWYWCWRQMVGTYTHIHDENTALRDMRGLWPGLWASRNGNSEVSARRAPRRPPRGEDV